LRVIDASVFPFLTASNTNLPTIMVAEKGADLVSGNRPPSGGDRRAALDQRHDSELKQATAERHS